MASREEEKRLRREERERAQAAAAASQGRAKRLQFLIGALLTIAVVVAVVVLVTGGDNKKSSDDSSTPTTPTDSNVAIPAPAERDLNKAAKAAGCVLLNPPLEGNNHVETKVKYKSNPPTSGNHNPIPALDGIYAPGQEPTPEHWVHALEHGRINIQYAAGTPAKQVEQLRAVYSEELNGLAGYKTLFYQNNTDMPYAVAATAWGHILGCKTFNDKIFDAIRDFRVKYVDKGPEPGIPPTTQ
jgi:hypothetical protein